MVAVRNLYTSLLVLLTQATDRELGRMVRYLKEKNRIFRARLPERINVIRKKSGTAPASWASSTSTTWSSRGWSTITPSGRTRARGTRYSYVGLGNDKRERLRSTRCQHSAT